MVLITQKCEAALAAIDTLVVCPTAFRAALAEWQEYRRTQGHEIQVVTPPTSASRLRELVHLASASGKLKYLLLIGDVPRRSPTGEQRMLNTTPTNYLPAKINVQWGSEPWIASDIPYADLDGDEVPDLAVGRIPVSTTEQLTIVLHKTLDYERKSEHGAWEKRLNIASGVGGFGMVSDALIEAAARQVITQNVPADYVTQHIHPESPNEQNPGLLASFPARARQQLNEGSLAWVYLGHGRVTELDRVKTSTGNESILSVGDVPRLHCCGHSPLAVLVACYTGAMDAPRNCLAEELLVATEGPVAVIAATRVTMPYGNTILGCELLRACFKDRPELLGDTLLLAERKTLQPSRDDQLRSSLDSLASGLSPAPVNLAGERLEHVQMYHLFGDPLIRLQRPVAIQSQAEVSSPSH
jgi:hypothetical protein